MRNIMILMAGKGSRFEKAGYTFPKPLIEVNGKPMIQVVVENLNISGNYIFLVLKEHYDKYSLKYLLPLICGENTCDIVIVDSITEGAACTALLAKEKINNDEELIIVNSDQYLTWNSEEFFQYMYDKNADAGILTFLACHPKWSFAKVDVETGLITEVAEKKPISNIATCGLYFWLKGKDFVWAAEQMITKDIRVNNEFYVCPTFNELIQDNKKVYNFTINGMESLGVPEDLNLFLSKHKV